MRIFVNNVDGYIAGAVCADLFKPQHTIVGTRKSRGDGLIPPVVKRLLPRTELRRLLKVVASSDLVIYDLHDADLEELEVVVRALHISEITQGLTFILISSVGTWARTHREYESVLAEAEQEEEGDGPGDEAAARVGKQAEPADGAADAADGAGGSGAIAAEPPVVRRPMPFRSEDYVRRMPAPKFQEWKSIETQVLALKEKGNVRPYIVCAGVPYGNGEDPFLGLFKASWQTRDSIRVIGGGDNCIPTVHVRDVARLVRNLVDVAPNMDYHLAVDRGQSTQRELLQSVASHFGLPYQIKSVSVAQAVLAELADILTLDLRMTPCELMAVPYAEEGSATGEDESAHVEAAPLRDPTPDALPGVGVLARESASRPGGSTSFATPLAEALPHFRWWCEAGLPANAGKVADEFCTWRRLQPVRFLILGPPGCGGDKLGSRLAARYNVPLSSFEAMVDERKNIQGTALGEKLRENLKQIAEALANPKAQGPYLLPSALSIQLMQEALEDSTAKFRGSAVAGFPQSLEEAAEFYLTDASPEPTDAEGEAPELLPAAAPPLARGGKSAPAEVVVAAEAVPKVVNLALLPDVCVLLTSSEEACMARAAEDFGLGESECRKRLERWKKDTPDEGPSALAAFFTEKCGMEPLCIDMDATSLDDAERQIVAQLEGKRPVSNFMLPVQDRGDSIAKDAQETKDDEAKDAEASRKEADDRRRRKEAEERLEVIKKEELQRLEKHSEPLRQYLMSLVVPTLTSAMIEVCREEPSDPVGYLSEYLAVYAEISKKRKNKRRSSRLST